MPFGAITLSSHRPCPTRPIVRLGQSSQARIENSHIGQHWPIHCQSLWFCSARKFNAAEDLPLKDCFHPPHQAPGENRPLYRSGWRENTFYFYRRFQPSCSISPVGTSKALQHFAKVPHGRTWPIQKDLGKVKGQETSKLPGQSLTSRALAPCNVHKTDGSHSAAINY